MEITPMTIYLISLADVVYTLAVAALILSLTIVMTALTMFRIIGDVGIRRLKCPLIALTISLVVLLTVPSGRSLAAMYVVPALANGEKVHDQNGSVANGAARWLEYMCRDTDAKKQ